ncbi:uncharacterized protein LOC126284285 [Schistocerca gregaria]|uniref:uncharacterized protein LOC126284285 n=1 Tax=Schistocerca gregaria TaxID=7010 RepID=UPI00211DA4A6|nr:uncharacterized protein LOC126284285 [Schistocerca gregaria]
MAHVSETGQKEYQISQLCFHQRFWDTMFNYGDVDANHKPECESSENFDILYTNNFFSCSENSVIDICKSCDDCIGFGLCDIFDVDVNESCELSEVGKSQIDGLLQMNVSEVSDLDGDETCIFSDIVDEVILEEYDDD